MRKASIVSVDDDPDFQLYLSQFLNDRGYAVDALTDGHQLFARLNSGPTPSLILLDMVLPDGDGLQIIEKMNASEIHVPVIMISAVGFVRPIVEAMKLGAADFLTKPLDEIAFEAAIEKVVQKSPSPFCEPAERPVHNTEQTASAADAQSSLEIEAAAAGNAERDLVRRVLKETHGSRKQAARIVNICYYKELLNKINCWAQPGAPLAASEVQLEAKQPETRKETPNENR